MTASVYRVTPVKRPPVLLPLTSDFSPLPRQADASLALKGKWRNDKVFVIWMRDLVGLENWILSITYGDNGIEIFAGDTLQGFAGSFSGTLQP